LRLGDLARSFEGVAEEVVGRGGRVEGSETEEEDDKVEAAKLGIGTGRPGSESMWAAVVMERGCWSMVAMSKSAWQTWGYVVLRLPEQV
jgi:hypothetical protein